MHRNLFMFPHALMRYVNASQYTYSWLFPGSFRIDIQSQMPGLIDWPSREVQKQRAEKQAKQALSLLHQALQGYETWCCLHLVL